MPMFVADFTQIYPGETMDENEAYAEIARLAGKLYDWQQKFERLRAAPVYFDPEQDRAAFIDRQIVSAEMHRADAALRDAQARFVRTAETSRKAGD